MVGSGSVGPGSIIRAKQGNSIATLDGIWHPIAIKIDQYGLGIWQQIIRNLAPFSLRSEQIWAINTHPGSPGDFYGYFTETGL